MRRVLVPFTFASVALAVACNAIIGLSGDYDADGADASTTTPPADGATQPGTDSSQPGTDTGPGPTTDAHVDVAPIPDASPDVFFPPSLDRSLSVRDAGLPDAVSYYCIGQPQGPGKFCWDFGSNNESDFFTPVIDHGDNSVVGPIGDAGRALRSTLTTTAGSTQGSAAFTYDRTSFGTATNYVFSFSFQVVEVQTYAVIASMQINGKEYGLAVEPTGFFGAPSFTDTTAGVDTPGVPFDPNAWYRGQITLTHTGTTWAGSITVGGMTTTKTIISRASNALPDGTTFPGDVAFEIGAFHSEAPAGTTVVWMDDVLLEGY